MSVLSNPRKESKAMDAAVGGVLLLRQQSLFTANFREGKEEEEKERERRKERGEKRRKKKSKVRGVK